MIPEIYFSVYLLQSPAVSWNVKSGHQFFRWEGRGWNTNIGNAKDASSLTLIVKMEESFGFPIQCTNFKKKSSFFVFVLLSCFFSPPKYAFVHQAQCEWLAACLRTTQTVTSVWSEHHWMCRLPSASLWTESTAEPSSGARLSWTSGLRDHSRLQTWCPVLSTSLSTVRSHFHLLLGSHD